MKKTLPATLAAVLLFLAGCGDSSSPCGDSFCVGLLLPLEADPQLDAALTRAASLAEDDINASGGNARIVRGDGTVSLAAARTLVNMGVSGVVGPSDSSAIGEIFDFLSRSETVAVSPLATSVSLTEHNAELARAGKRRFFFRTVPPDIFQAKILARQARGEVLIIHRGDDYGRNLARLVAGELEAAGRAAPEILEYEEYGHTDEDADSRTRDVVARAESLPGIGGFDSMVMITFREGAGIIKGLLDSPAVPGAARYFVSDGLAGEDMAERVDADDPSAVAGFSGTSSYPLADPPRRNAEFESRFDRNEIPSLVFTAHTYDAVVVMALAALAAKSTDPSRYVSEVADVTGGGTKCRSYAECAGLVRNGADIDYEGISGPIDLDENGNISRGFYAVWTYDAEGGRTARVFEIPGLDDAAPVPRHRPGTESASPETTRREGKDAAAD